MCGSLGGVDKPGVSSSIIRGGGGGVVKAAECGTAEMCEQVRLHKIRRVKVCRAALIREVNQRTDIRAGMHAQRDGPTGLRCVRSFRLRLCSRSRSRSPPPEPGRCLPAPLLSSSSSSSSLCSSSPHSENSSSSSSPTSTWMLTLLCRAVMQSEGADGPARPEARAQAAGCASSGRPLTNRLKAASIPHLAESEHPNQASRLLPGLDALTSPSAPT